MASKVLGMMGVKSPIDVEEYTGKIEEALGKDMLELPGKVKAKIDQIKKTIGDKKTFSASVGKKGKKQVTLNSDSTDGEIVAVAGEIEAGDEFKGGVVDGVWGVLEEEIHGKIDEAEISMGKGVIKKGTEKAIRKAILKALEKAVETAMTKISAKEEA